MTTKRNRRRKAKQKRDQHGRFARLGEPPLLTFPPGTFGKGEPGDQRDAVARQDFGYFAPPRRTLWRRVRDFFRGRP